MHGGVEAVDFGSVKMWRTEECIMTKTLCGSAKTGWYEVEVEGESGGGSPYKRSPTGSVSFLPFPI